MTTTMNIEIEKTVFAFPKDYHPKPYTMTIKVPIHNYMVSKRTTDPPWIKLSKDDLWDIFRQIAKELDYDLDTLNNTKEMHQRHQKLSEEYMDMWIKQIKKKLGEGENNNTKETTQQQQQQ